MRKPVVAKIEMGKDRTLYLHGKNMNELVDKIIEWQDWEKNEEVFNNFAKKGSNNINDKYIAREKKSGWYYKKVKK